MQKQFDICEDCIDTVAEFKASVQPVAVPMPFPLPLKVSATGQAICAVCEGDTPVPHKVWFNVAKYDETTYQPIKDGT